MALTTNVPSDRFEDLQRDVQDATRFPNATASYQNRIGQTITPLPLLQEQINASIQATGWFPAAGSFEAGGTITERNQYLQLVTTVGDDIAGGYSWGGALPKVVPPGSTPATTGDTGPDAWTYRSDAALRSALAAPDSTVLVGGVEARALRTVNGIKSLLPVANVAQSVIGFYSDVNYGGGGFIYNPNRSHADHNGGTVLSKTAVDVWDGTFADLATLLNWTGSGLGCYERILLAGPALPQIEPEMFGAVPNDISKPSELAISKAFTLKSECKLGARYYTNDTVRIGTGKCSMVTGVGMYQCGFTCIDPDANVLELENDGFGLSCEHFFVNHTSLGTGDGIVATSGNRSFTYRNILAETCRRGFSFDGVVYVFDIYSCRATNCVTGYYTDNPLGNSTSFSFYSCYATNVQIGFDIGQTKSLVMVQPIMDINRAGCNRMIRLRTVAVANITNIHLEGVPDVTGVCVEVTGSNTRTVNILGFHCDTRCPVGAEWFVLAYNFAGSAVVSLDGLDGSQATNTKLYTASNSAGDSSRLVFGDGNFMGGIDQGLTGRVRSGIAGSLIVRNPSFTGTIDATSGATITTGLLFAPNQVLLTVNKPASGEALVVANPYEFGSGGTFRVRFVKMSDQTADFGTHSLTWRAEMTFR